MSAIVFLITNTAYVCLFLFFHPLPPTTPTLLLLSFASLTYTSLACLAIYFALESPATRPLLSPSLVSLLLTILYAALPLLTPALALLHLLPLTGVGQAALLYLGLYAAAIKLLLLPSSPTRTTPRLPPALVYYHCWMLIFTPCLLHCFIHSAAPLSLTLCADVVLLLTLPFLALALASYTTLLASSPFTSSLYSSQGEKDRLEVAVAFISTLVCLACVEYRVIIVSFAPLLYYHASWPIFSTLVLTVFLYSALTAFLLLLTGLTDDHSTSSTTSASSTRVKAFHLSVLVASVSLALTLGLLFLIPLLPLISYAFSSFFFTRSLLSYSAFLASVLCALLYFAHQHFWFLDVQVAGGLSLSELSIVLIGLALLALLVPALPLIPLPSLLSIYAHSTSFLLLLYLTAFALLEFLLHSTNSAYPTPIYPSVFPLLTTGLALYITSTLHHSHRINRFTYSLLLSIALGKLSVLVVDTGTDFVHALLISVAVTSPYTMYIKKMHWILSVGHAAITTIVLFLAKNTVLAHLLRLVGVEQATESTYVSAYVLVTLVSLLPLSAPYAHIRRVHILALGVGAMFAALQPRLPSWLFSGESDVFDVAHEVDRSYSGWLLMAVAGLLLSAVLGVRPVTRAAMNVAGAMLLCVYMCTEHLPPAFPLYLFFGVIFVSAALIASIAASPADPSFVYPPLVMLTLLYCMAFPLTFIATTLLFAMRGYSVEEMEQSRIILVTTYAALSLLLSIVVNYHRITSPLPANATAPAPYASFTLSPSSDPQAPLLTISNLFLFLCYLASAVLLVHYLHHSEVVVVFLAPLLLFFHYDSGGGQKGRAWNGGVDPSRFLPMLSITALILFISAMASVLHPLLSPLHALTPDQTFVWTPTFALLEGLLCLPAVLLVVFCAAAVQSGVLRLSLVVVAPCGLACIAGTLVSQLDSVKLLDGMGVLVCLPLFLNALERL